MTSALRTLLPLSLLLGVGCGWIAVPERPKIFAPHEAGLTLVFENPALPEDLRKDQRLQVRVAASKDSEAGKSVTMTYTSLRGTLSALYLHRDGGLYMTADGKTPGPLLLPPGFPDRISQWETRGVRHRILGRATVDLPGFTLPETADHTGVWIESESSGDPKQRSFLLPDLGEVETRVWRDGSWVCVNRLVARRFTDLPTGSIESR